MPPSPESANTTLPVYPEAEVSPDNSHKPSHSPDSDDLPYMTVTVVAILLLLGSLWIFKSLSHTTPRRVCSPPSVHHRRHKPAHRPRPSAGKAAVTSVAASRPADHTGPPQTSILFPNRQPRI